LLVIFSKLNDIINYQAYKPISLADGAWVLFISKNGIIRHLRRKIAKIFSSTNSAKEKVPSPSTILL